MVCLMICVGRPVRNQGGHAQSSYRTPRILTRRSDLGHLSHGSRARDGALTLSPEKVKAEKVFMTHRGYVERKMGMHTSEISEIDSR